MRLSAAVLAATLVATAAEAREVVFPLLVDHALLRASLARQLGEEADGSALVWGTRGGCRSLVLRDLRVGAAAGRVRVSAQATAHLGFRFLGFCFAPLSWKGNLESVARPALGDGWQLRLRDLDSHVYDAAWQRTMVASPLWDVVKGGLESELTAFAFDLAPPVEEAQGLIRASVEPARARPVLEALATLHPLGVEVDEAGVKVQVALELPPADATPPPPEPPLAPMEMARWQQLLESWDGFLVFVVKDLGAAADPGLRDELLDLLLASRHGLPDAPTRGRIEVARPADRLGGAAAGRAGHDRSPARSLAAPAGRAHRVPRRGRPATRVRRRANGRRERGGGPVRAALRRPGPGGRLAGELLAAVRGAGRAGHLPPLEERRRGHHAGEPARVAGVLRSRQTRVGHHLPRGGGRRDPGAAPDALRRARGERASGECRPRDLRGVQRRARRLPTLPARPGPARAARGRSRLLGEVSGGGDRPRARLRPLCGALEHARARAALQRIRPLDAEVLQQLAQLAGHRLDLPSPRRHRPAAARPLRVDAAREALLDGVVAAEERLPRGEVAGVDARDALRARCIAAQVLEVRQDARPAVGDLPADLGLVHELRGEDALDGAVGLGLDRGPAPGPRKIRPQLDLRRIGRDAAAGDQDAQDERRAETPSHGVWRNPRTPRRKVPSWSWWTQCPARSTVMMCGL